MEGQIVAEPTKVGIRIVYRITGGDEKCLKCFSRQKLNMCCVIQGYMHRTMLSEV
jgi:hypothetical protein